MPSTGTLVFNDQKLQAPEMYVTESLGVGVSVPTSNLEVTGNAYVSSNLHIGENLGLGVAEPTSRLEIAGNEQLQEYPPRAMTGHETYMEGHGVFRVEADSYYTPTNPDLEPWLAFNDVINLNFGRWRQQSGQFTAGGGPIDSRAYASGLPNASWLVLHLPYRVNLKRYSICPQTGQSPGNIQIWGSNDGTSWARLHSQTQTEGDNTTYQNYTMSHEGHYSIIAYLVLTLLPNTATEISIRDMKYFGTPAPTTLDDGHLTLGKTLTTPRVSGHAAGAETPRAESLVVNYDTTVNSVVSGSTVVDTSGAGNNGTFNGNPVYSSADRAIQFDGSGDYISTPVSEIPASDWAFTVSFWLKRTSNSTPANSAACPFFIGDNASQQGIGLDIYTDSGGAANDVYWYVHSGKYKLWDQAANTMFPVNVWVHVAATHAVGFTDERLYINGVEQTNFISNTTAGDVALDAGDTLNIGSRDNVQHFFGDVSNIKLWGGITLTADEIAAEYALGRTGKALNVIDTAVCLGGTVPRAQLDVRGTGMFDGGLVIKADNLEYARDGGITLSRAGLGTAGNEYSSQPIVLDGGDAGAVDANIRGGAIWSQWGGAQYGIAMKGASMSDAYPYLHQTPMMFVTNDKVGIGVTSPSSKLHVNGRIRSDQPRFFAYSNNGSTSFSGGGTIALNSTAYNSGSHYSTSTGYFTAPVNGVYHFTVGLYTYTAEQFSWKLVPTAGSLTNNNLHVSRNNGTGDDLLILSAFNSGQYSGSITLYLNAGEQFGWGSRSSSGNYYGAHSHFSGYLLSQV